MSTRLSYVYTLAVALLLTLPVLLIPALLLLA
jgi:hypothetical protein